MGGRLPGVSSGRHPLSSARLCPLPAQQGVPWAGAASPPLLVPVGTQGGAGEQQGGPFSSSTPARRGTPSTDAETEPRGGQAAHGAHSAFLPHPVPVPVTARRVTVTAPVNVVGGGVSD